MSDKPKHPIAKARALAEKIVERLRPCCLRIEIAGSIRRQKPMVGDIEIVYIPNTARIKDPHDFFGDKEITVNAVDHELDKLIAEGKIAKRLNVKEREAWGPQNKLAVAVATGIPVDFFRATTDNWYNYLVCRTGGALTNTHIASAAKAKGYKWNPYGSGFSTRVCGEGRRIVINSEEQVFHFVNLPYLPPEKRP